MWSHHFWLGYSGEMGVESWDRVIDHDPFGSAARGEMGAHSDVDLLVIKSGANRLDLAGQIYRHMHGMGEAVDIIVVTPEDIDHYCDSHVLVIAPALREGKVVYIA